MSRPADSFRLLPDGAGTNRGSSDQLRLAAVFREIEVERSQLADLLNDDPVQTLAHIARVLRSLEDMPGTPARAAGALIEAARLAASMSERLRVLARRLRPPLLDDVGLAAALRQLASDVSAASGITVRAYPGSIVRTGVPEADLVLYRVAQEALRNAETHAAATFVEIRLRRRLDRVSLSVRDNGIGLAGHPETNGSGKGFLEMRERLRSVEGKLTVRSRLRLGTVVVASVPTSPWPEPPASTRSAETAEIHGCPTVTSAIRTTFAESYGGSSSTPANSEGGGCRRNHEPHRN